MEAELQIARKLWRLGGATAREVPDVPLDDSAPDYRTVQTYLRRVGIKGQVRSKLVGRNKVYPSRVQPAQADQKLEAVPADVARQTSLTFTSEPVEIGVWRVVGDK